jgi:hypothetical protein
MRSHGVSNFPDPIISQQAGGTTVTIKWPAGSSLAPALHAAGQACRGILPSPQQISGANMAREPGRLAFARCMRRHSVADFPDPTSHGQLTLEMLASAGIDFRAPNVLSAAKTCLPVSNGAITPAEIQHAVSGQDLLTPRRPKMILVVPLLGYIVRAWRRRRAAQPVAN